MHTTSRPAHIRRSIIGIIGVAFTLIFPAIWLVTTKRPHLLEGGERAGPSDTFFMYHALPYLSDSMGLIFLLFLLGFFGTLLLTQALIPRTRAAWRRLAVVVLLIATFIFMIVTAIDWINPLYRNLDRLDTQGRTYYLLEGEYRSGPKYRVVVECSMLGVVCHYRSEPTQERVNLQEYVEKLQTSPQP